MASGDEFFFNNFICDLDDLSLDQEDFVVATLIVNGHIARQRPRFRVSILGHAPTLNQNREIVDIAYSSPTTFNARPHSSVLSISSTASGW